MMKKIGKKGRVGELSMENPFVSVIVQPGDRGVMLGIKVGDLTNWVHLDEEAATETVSMLLDGLNELRKKQVEARNRGE